MKTTNEPNPLNPKQAYDKKRQSVCERPRPWISRDTELKPPKDATPPTLVKYIRRALKLHGQGRVTPNCLNAAVNACRLLTDIHKAYLLDERLTALERMTTRKK